MKKSNEHNDLMVLFLNETKGNEIFNTKNASALIDLFITKACSH